MATLDAEITIETLFAERQIYRQLTRFARGMDERDWEAVAAICTEDICADFGTGELVGIANVIALMRTYLDNCGTTQHLLGNVLIDIDGDSATSESYVSDMHLASDEQRDIQFRTLGNYSDAWVRRDGHWLLSKRVKNNRATVGSMEVFGESQ